MADDPAAITERLAAVLDADREKAGIAELSHYGNTIEMEFINGENWAIECFGPDAFHFYPGVTRDDTVIWTNVWVARDLTLEEMADRLEKVAASAKGKNLNA